jgi:hypothetical protein
LGSRNVTLKVPICSTSWDCSGKGAEAGVTSEPRMVTPFLPMTSSSKQRLSKFQRILACARDTFMFSWPSTTSVPADLLWRPRTISYFRMT